MRGGASTLAWSYFEKLVCLQNMSQDRSDTGTGSVSDPMPVPSGEITVEALLDTLAWAVNRFGQLATVISKVQEAATSMAASSGLLNPKLDAQHTSLVRMADGLLALSANIKVNSEHAGPMLAGIKALQKQMENCSWQISGSGAKLVNVSVKELLMSQGKNIGENTANTTRQALPNEALCTSTRKQEGITRSHWMHDLQCMCTCKQPHATLATVKEVKKADGKILKQTTGKGET